MALSEYDADEQELQLFLAETNDHLQLLDENIVRLEATPGDTSLLQSIFRSAHTIKGGAGLLGHQRMAELAHAMENVLDGLRSHALQVTPAIIDALLAALDTLRALNQEIVTRVPSDAPVDRVIAALDACRDGRTVAADGAADEATQVPREGAVWRLDAELSALLEEVPAAQVLDVWVSIDVSGGLSAARAVQAYYELQRCARILRSIPTPEQITHEESCDGLRALVVTAELPSLVEHRLSQITNVMAAQVTTAVLVDATADEASGPQAEAAGAPAAGEPGRPRPGKPSTTDTSIRISVATLDNLMSLVSELVLGRTRLQTLRADLQERYSGDESVDNLSDAIGHLEHISTDLQALVMKARMLSVENVFNKFPRLMRDLVARSGKQVAFSMSGQETELDRSVIEQLSDPLIHLLRNAVDHGLEAPAARAAAGKPERGAITLSAKPCENHILIAVSDDGGGIDGTRLKATAVAKGLLTQEAADRLGEREAVELIFLPGLSTARAITDISGRGVGMDIVKATIERMGGHIEIDSRVGAGTTFAITLPLTLAIIQALLVSVDRAVYAVPLNMVTEILSVPPSAVQRLHGTEATLLRETILPLVRLREYFGCPAAEPGAALHVVATRVDGQALGLVVDRFIGEQEIVMKPLGAYIGATRGVAGATILGDGRIGLLVDIAAISHQLSADS